MKKLFADTTAYIYGIWGVAIFRGLKTEFHALSRLDVAIPAKIGCCIRIGTGNSGVPAVSDTRAVGVGPANTPSADRGGAVIGNPDCTGEAIAPFIADDVCAVSSSGNRAARRAGDAG